jgi:hypothetical protein
METTIGKVRSPVPNWDPEIASEPSAKRAREFSDVPPIAASTQFLARFPPPQVYQDPGVTSKVIAFRGLE